VHGHRNSRMKKTTICAAIANAIGIASYLVAASMGWSRPEEYGTNATSGEPFIWMMGAVPVFIIFFLINAIWGFSLFRKTNESRAWKLYSLVMVAWICAVLLDFSRH